MLFRSYRMYTRYADRNGFSVEVLDMLDGDEAGIKSVTFQVNGENAYFTWNARATSSKPAHSCSLMRQRTTLRIPVLRSISLNNPRASKIVQPNDVYGHLFTIRHSFIKFENILGRLLFILTQTKTRCALKTHRVTEPKRAPMARARPYRVPKMRSPASPRPGTMYAASLRPSSMEHVYRRTSGSWSSTVLIPSGAATNTSRRTSFTP